MKRFGFQAIRGLVGDAPRILDIYPSETKLAEAVLAYAPQGRYVAIAPNDDFRGYYDAKHSPQVVCLRALLSTYSDFDETTDQFAYSVDWHRDIYPSVLDVVICRAPDTVHTVVIGGARTLDRARYLFLAEIPGMGAFLPQFELTDQSFSGGLLLRNKQPPVEAPNDGY